ncbi:hypothetical protein [Pseudolactococcus laudensis]|uniref:hypothetical protein n=1 Tax=Pseudolactococcus laudensis TaxID=1494461 RepID=UPI0012DDC085
MSHSAHNTNLVFFWQNSTKLVRKVPFLCEIGILLAKQYEIGKNKLFFVKIRIHSAYNTKKEKNKLTGLPFSFGD